jgi:2-polyprenyl-3-methyl-5-hydroxy-6-metoxy-1,4-benzoquinol methylase
MLIGNRQLYPGGIVPTNESNEDFFTRFCVWADSNGFSKPEYLLPTINRTTAISQFRFEQRFVNSGLTPPPEEMVRSLGPWDYHIAWSGLTTRDFKLPTEWMYHRYRSSLFVDLAAELAGPTLANMSVLDVACHCGVLALEFGEAGFGSVKGLDLRENNIRKAEFLKETFACSNVSFEVRNARDLSSYSADIVFCGGLLYHVTFPVELVRDLFDITKKYLIFDTLCQNHPFSGFHLNGGRDVELSVNGDDAVELTPTYRAVIDLLRAAGCSEIYEILGSGAEQVPFYKDRQVRSFIAAKPGFGIPEDLVAAPDL